MSRSISELRRTGGALLVLVVLAILFAYGQNRLGYTGGNIALPKLMWLMTAIWAWYVQPFLLCVNSRLQGVARYGMQGFIAIMAVRAVVEGVMLYATHNWSPIYGIVFNVFAIFWLCWIAFRVKGLIAAHMISLVLMFMAECGFALYMKTHFVTTGDVPIYFVPDDPRYQLILQLSWAAVAASWAWQAYFLKRWLCIR